MYSTCSELGILMHSTGNSINNLSSYLYFGLVNARIRASDKDLPVKTNSFVRFLGGFDDTKSPFKIIWPLAISHTNLLMHQH